MARRAVATVLLVAGMLWTAPASAGGGCHQTDEVSTEGIGTTVDLRSNCFSPTILRTGRGEEVTFVNRDQIPHLIEGVGWAYDGELKPGAKATQRFAEYGTFPYACRLHPGMSGVIDVGNMTELQPLPPAATPIRNDDGWPAGPVVAVGVIVAFFAFAAGRVSMRDRPAA